MEEGVGMLILALDQGTSSKYPLGVQYAYVYDSNLMTTISYTYALTLDLKIPVATCMYSVNLYL